MKKLTLLFVSAIALTLSANAQIYVCGNGHVQVGDPSWFHEQAVFPGLLSPTGDLTKATISISKPDTTASISINGPDDYAANGKIIFGGRNDVSLSESYDPENPIRKLGSLCLTGKGGIFLYSNTGLIMSYDIFTSLNGTDKYFNFKKTIQAPEYLTVSDLRYKRDIKSLESFGRNLEQLSPVSFSLKLPNDESATQDAASKESVSSQSATRHFGFIAQEVREIFPELVREDENGMLSIDYMGFIPLLVDAYKEMKAQVAEQQEIIDNLTSGSKKSKGTADVENIYGDASIVLMQNRPNPFKSETEIRCHLPQEVAQALICIYDLNGRQQMRFDLQERGDVFVTVSGSSLQPGMYIYSLITDGKEADSKRMILTD